MDETTAQQLLEQVKADYDIIAEHFSYTRSRQWYEVAYLIEQYIQPGQQVLDLGCGNGRVADLVHEIKALYTGMDVSAGLIECARKLHPKDNFYVGSMQHTGFPDHTFDHTLMIASFHHIPGTELRIQTLQEAKRITKPGGFIMMTNWNLHQLMFRKKRWLTNMQKLFGRHARDWNDLLIPWKDKNRNVKALRYYHGFTMREIEHLAKRTRLSIVDQYYETNGLHVPRYKAKNLVSILRQNT